MLLPTSPYVRKVRACAIAREIDSQIELVPTDANASSAGIRSDQSAFEGAGLVTEDGVALFDSPVICEYLDSVGDALPMFPTHGAARWRALKLQAMGDGILDASVPAAPSCRSRRMSGAWHGSRGRRRRWTARWTRWRPIRRIARSILARSPSPARWGIWISATPSSLGGRRIRSLPRWYQAFAQNPGIAKTVPKDAA